jgi:hypothetical protein
VEAVRYTWRYFFYKFKSKIKKQDGDAQSLRNSLKSNFFKILPCPLSYNRYLKSSIQWKKGQRKVRSRERVV